MSFREMYAELDSVAKYERREMYLTMRFLNRLKRLISE